MGILVIDDSLDHRVFLKGTLDHSGYGDILTAGSYALAMDILNGRDKSGRRNKIDLILLDIVMPEVDGLEALRRIKDVPEFHEIPVIMVTGKNDMKDLEFAFAAGANDYVNKPFHKIELIARINSALRLRREMAQRRMHEEELEIANKELVKLLVEIKSLRELFPVCAVCQSPRSENHYMKQAKEHLTRNPLEKHAYWVCPGCEKK